MARQSRGHTCAALTSSRSPLQIRPYETADWPAVWALLEPVFRAGETIPHDPAITEAEAKVAWVEQSQAVMGAVDAAARWWAPTTCPASTPLADALHQQIVVRHCQAYLALAP